MLNEAYDLLQALQKADIKLPSYYPGVTEPGENAGPCLRVCLQQNSSIRSVEVLAQDERPGLWTIMDGNQDSRPVIRLTVPLLQVPLDDDWWKSIGYKDSKRQEDVSDCDKLEAIKRALEESKWFPSFTVNNGDENCNRITQFWKRIREKAKGLADLLNGNKKLENVQKVFERIGNLPDMQDFAVCLRSAIEARLKSNPLPVTLVETLLVGKRKRERGEWAPPESKMQLAFDIDDGRTIYLNETRTVLEKILEERDRNRDEFDGKAVSRCAFGSAGPLQESSFPNPQLPIVAVKGMPLVSMFSDARTNTRYGLTDSAIVPVGKELASQMAKALRWITDDERKGKTWRGVANGIFENKHEQQDLLISYVDGKPDIANSDIFGKDQDSFDNQFEVDSKTVCEALDAIVNEMPTSKLRLYVLRQVSQGQVQTVCSRSLEIEQIITGAELWKKGAQNLPPIVVPLPEEKGKPPKDGHPMAPYPDQIVRLLCHQWIRKGAMKDMQKPCVAVRRPSFGAIIDLLVREPAKFKNVAYDLLRRCLVQISPLLQGLTDAVRTKDKKRHEYYPLRSRYQALIACGTLGLALHALNSQKEDYMQNSAFAVGKMLALADDIHHSYCEVVRNGSIPPSLLGNSLLSTAMENPARAIAVLGDRLKIYIGWVKTVKKSELSESGPIAIAIKTARKRLAQYESFVTLIANDGFPQKMDDMAKAHLLLGYLASTKANKEGEQTDE